MGFADGGGVSGLPGIFGLVGSFGLPGPFGLLIKTAIPVLEYDFSMRAIRKLVQAGGKGAFD